MKKNILSTIICFSIISAANANNIALEEECWSASGTIICNDGSIGGAFSTSCQPSKEKLNEVYNEIRSLLCPNDPTPPSGSN